MNDNLERRVRANCSDIHGLTPSQFEQHVAGIVRMINKLELANDYHGANDAMPEPCHYCDQPVLLSKHAYRTQHVQANGAWTKLIWHTKCDPYRVTTTVTRRNT